MSYTRTHPSAGVVSDLVLGDGTTGVEWDISTVSAGVTTKRFRFLDTGVAIIQTGITVSAFALGVVHSSAAGVFSSGPVLLSELGQSGATSGQIAAWSGSAWAPFTISSGGLGAVPTSRTLTGTAPITIDGVNTPVDLSANRTIAVANATTGAVGVAQLANDLAGTATAPVVLHVHGPNNATSVFARNAANLADLAVITKLATDDIRFGSASIGVHHYSAGLHAFESGSGGNWWQFQNGTLSADASWNPVIITQDRSTTGSTHVMIVGAQAAKIGSGGDGGILQLFGGIGDGAGHLGAVQTIADAVYSYARLGHQFWDPSGTVLYMTTSTVARPGTIVFGPTMTGPSIGQEQAASGAGAALGIAAQSGGIAGGVGGVLNLLGGLGTGGNPNGPVVVTGNLFQTNCGAAIFNRVGDLALELGGDDGLGTTSVVSSGKYTQMIVGIAQSLLSISPGLVIMGSSAKAGSGAQGGSIGITAGTGDGAGSFGAIEMAGSVIALVALNDQIVLSGEMTGWDAVNEPLRFGVTQITGLSGSNVTLTPAQYAKQTISLSGLLTANINIFMPDVGGWTKFFDFSSVIFNGHTITIRTVAALGPTVSNTDPKKQWFYHDAAGVF